MVFFFLFFLFQFLYNTKQLPACMFNKQFQVFGMHIYLQEPTKLLCTPIVPEDTKDRPTEPVPVKPKRPPSRTIINVIDSDRDKNSKSDNYAFNRDTSNSNIVLSNLSTCLIGVLVFLVLYGQS